MGQPWKVPPEVAVCLGTIDCSPIQIASAYQVFANQGVGVRPQFFRSIVDNTGRVIVPLKHFEQQIINPMTAYQMQYMLRQVVLRGTGYSKIGSAFQSPPYPPICGKTGTTNDCRDAWFCGFTPDLVIACQVGFDRPRPLGPGMTGGRVAGPIWAKAFEGIIQTREQWSKTFEKPEDIEFCDICAATGKRVSDFCMAHDHKTYIIVPFKKGTAPVQKCDGVPVVPIIKPVGPEWAYLGRFSPVQGMAHLPTDENVARGPSVPENW
jgi:penicillin-binding protein 1A